MMTLNVENSERRIISAKTNHYVPSVRIYLSLLVGDACSPPLLKLEGATGIWNCKCQLDAVVERCDFLLLASVASRICPKWGERYVHPFV
jgi:hypothetical protein